MGLFGASTSHEWSLRWQVGLINIICKRNWLDWEGGIMSILYCDCESVTLHNSTSHLQYSYSESYGAWKLFCCIIAKYIWGIAVVRGSGMGQDCGKLPNMVNQQKYLTRTEMVYSSKNGMVITNSQTMGIPRHTKQFLHEKIIPLRIACSAVNQNFRLQTSQLWNWMKLWVTVNTCHKVRTKTSKTCTNFLKYHKLRFVA